MKPSCMSGLDVEGTAVLLSGVRSSFPAVARRVATVVTAARSTSGVIAA